MNIRRLKFQIDDLVDEILSKIPEEYWTSDSATFADLEAGGGQFIKGVIKKLRAYGHSDSNIQSRVYAYFSGPLSMTYAIKTHKLIGLFSIFNIMTDSIERKFDVIVGNPPFQDGNTKSMRDPLWPKFINLGLNILKENGIFSLIIPPQWIHNKKIFEKLSKKNILFLNYKECKKYFLNVSANQHFSYFILENADYVGKTEVISTDKNFKRSYKYTFKIDDEQMVIPTGVVPITHELFSILNKISKREKFNIIRGLTVSNVKGPYSKIKDEVFKFETWYSTKQTLWSSVPVKGYGVEKVIINYTSYYHKSFHQEHLDWHMPIKKNVGVGLQGAYIETKFPEILRITLNRKLYIFLSEVHRSGAYWAALDKFPKVDDSKSWTDQELYEYFNLTQEEIDYIEENV